MTNELYDSLLSGVRTLLVVGAPPLVILFAVGIAASVLESVLSLHEIGIHYVVRLLALVSMLLLLAPYWWRTLIEFTRQSLG